MTALRIILLFAVACMPCAAQTQHAPPGLKPHFSAIIVSDMGKSIEWYTTVLGFKVVNQSESKERGFKQCNLATGEAALELAQLAAAVSPGDVIPGYTEKTRLVGFFKTGFEVTEFDAWIEHMQRMKVKLSGNVVNDPTTRKRMFIILDPDGNRIQLFEH